MKHFLLLSIIICVATNIYADDNIKVLSDDFSVVRDPEITAKVVFDYSEMEIKDTPYIEYFESKGSEYEKEWTENIKNAEEYFIKCWNRDNSQGMKVSEDFVSEYTMIIFFERINPGSDVLSKLVGFGAGGASMDGKLHIYMGEDMEAPVFSVDISGQTGGSGKKKDSDKTRLKDMYGELAEDIVKAVKEDEGSKLKDLYSGLTDAISKVIKKSK